MAGSRKTLLHVQKKRRIAAAFFSDSLEGES